MVHPLSRHHAVARPIASQAFCENDLSGGGKQADARVLNQILCMARGLGNHDQIQIYQKKRTEIKEVQIWLAKTPVFCFHSLFLHLGTS